MPNQVSYSTVQVVDMLDQPLFKDIVQISVHMFSIYYYCVCLFNSLVK